jgi:membrane-associated protease RseP (regulator of RpoE activity)
MYRKFLFTALAGLLIASGWAAAPLHAQGPQPLLRPGLPQPALRPPGLLVTRVFPGSTAAQQGIEPGDIILAVNGAPVRSNADLARALAWSGREAALEVIDCRTGWQNTIVVYPENGRIGVLVQPVATRGARPIPPIGPGEGWPIPPIGPPEMWPIPPIGPGPIRPIPPIGPGVPPAIPLPLPSVPSIPAVPGSPYGG